MFTMEDSDYQELCALLAAPAEDGPLISEGTIRQVSDCAENVRAMDEPSRDDSIAWLMRIDGIGRSRAELICSMGFRRMPEPVSALKGAE
jgi:hypothetical protein